MILRAAAIGVLALLLLCASGDASAHPGVDVPPASMPDRAAATVDRSPGEARPTGEEPAEDAARLGGESSAVPSRPVRMVVVGGPPAIPHGPRTGPARSPRPAAVPSPGRRSGVSAGAPLALRV